MLICFLMILYFIVIAYYPFHSRNNCNSYELHRGYGDFKKFGHAFYVNTLICLGGWVS